MLRAYLTRRGGSGGTEVPFSALSVTRVRNDVGQGSVWVPVGSDPAVDLALAGVQRWRDEVSVYDDPDPEPLWAGPVTAPAWNRSEVVLDAKDLFAWFDHRVLPVNRHYQDDDLGIIFAAHCADALRRDPSPNIRVVLSPAGVTGDRAVSAAQWLYAGDALRELSRSGVDWTMAGRDLLVTPPDQTARLPALIDSLVDAPSIQPGGEVATEAAVLGVTAANGSQIVGVASVPDATGGLLTVVRNEPAIRDALSARHAAQATVTAVTGDVLTCTVLPGWAPLRDIVPGLLVQVSVTVGVRALTGDYRLSRATFSAGSNGDPAVSVVLVPVEA